MEVFKENGISRKFKEISKNMVSAIHCGGRGVQLLLQLLLPILQLLEHSFAGNKSNLRSETRNLQVSSLAKILVAGNLHLDFGAGGALLGTGLGFGEKTGWRIFLRLLLLNLAL